MIKPSDWRALLFLLHEMSINWRATVQVVSGFINLFLSHAKNTYNV